MCLGDITNPSAFGSTGHSREWCVSEGDRPTAMSSAGHSQEWRVSKGDRPTREFQKDVAESGM